MNILNYLGRAKNLSTSVGTHICGLAGLSIVRDREMVQEHVVVDSAQLIGVKAQQKAVNRTFNTKSLHTFTIVVHEEDGP